MEKKLPKIVYVTNARLPTEKAHGLATIKLCEAFVNIGYDVDVVAPRMWRRSGGDIFKYYGVKENFKIFKILTIDLMPFGIPEKLAFLMQIFSFSLFALFYLSPKYRKSKNVVFFSHDYIPLYFLTFISPKTFFDVHHFPGKNFMYRRLMKKSFGFAVQTRWKEGALEKEWGIDSKKIIYWPNGTDVEKFKLNISKEEAREKLNLPKDKNIILYTGQLFDWKGVNTLIRTIDIVSNKTFIYLVGGAKKDVKKLKKEISQAQDKRIKFISFQPHNLIPLWQRAADVLVLPNTAKQKVSLYYTSPMKLFEYMASGTPIIASNIPSITEILSEKNAFLAEPDNPSSLGEIINNVLENPKKAMQRALHAQSDADKYTWENRAKKISDYF